MPLNASSGATLVVAPDPHAIMAGIAALASRLTASTCNANQIGHDLVDVAELAVPPEPGVVHQQVRLSGGDDPLQLGDAARIDEVGHMNLNGLQPPRPHR